MWHELVPAIAATHAHTRGWITRWVIVVVVAAAGLLFRRRRARRR
jgi:hypothetical protein